MNNKIGAIFHFRENNYKEEEIKNDESEIQNYKKTVVHILKQKSQIDNDYEYETYLSFALVFLRILNRIRCITAGQKTLKSPVQKNS